MKAILLAVCLLGAGEAPRPGVFRRKVGSSAQALVLHRYVPEGLGSARPPVLLVPNVGMGRAAFDLSGQGLARYLHQRGRDVFVLVPAPGRALTELEAVDLPAAFAAVLSERGDRFDLVGHGYGGTLALAAAAHPAFAGKVGRVVALSTPVRPELPNPLVEALLAGGRGFEELGNDPASARLFNLLMTRGGRFSSGVLSELRRAGFAPLGKVAAGELLSWMRGGDLRLKGGGTVLTRLSAYDRPTLLVLPLGDNYAHPEFASVLREVSPKARVVHHVLSAFDGHDGDYSHLSVLHGAQAPDEVYAPAQAFLDAAEAPLAKELP